jgi:twitching motility protein PilT
MDFDELLRSMVKEQGSDLYLRVNTPPIVRMGDDLRQLSESAISSEEMDDFARTALGEWRWGKFGQQNEIDTAYSVKGVGRFRLSIYRQRGTLAMAIRWVRTDMESFEGLNLPPVLEKISLFEKGLVLITGSTGSGKSTTQAAIIDYINMRRRCSIVTIEDPIEFLHADKMSIVTQREIGIDTDSFQDAMIHVVRQHPDVILVGEMRDPDTFAAALSASETGHLVLSTLHTMDVVHSFGRILDYFPPSQHNQVRALLALNLRAMTCQRLISRKDGKGLIPAVEVMIVTPAVRKLIRDNEMRKVPLIMQNDESGEMRTLNQSLLELVDGGLISEEDALANSNDAATLKMNLRGIRLDEQRGILAEG